MSSPDPKEILARAQKNLGTFSTTQMQEQAANIFHAYAPLNAVDSFAYPEFIEKEQTCGNFFLDLFHANAHSDFSYFTTSGSSEALFMSLLFMKNFWKLRNQDNTNRPNFIISSSGHTAWHKAATYLDIALKILPIDSTRLNLDESHLFQAIDNNTIGIGCSLGATTTLVYDEIEKINIALNDYRNKKNVFIPIHVDGASGGLVAPFCQKELIWDFRLNHVMSINVSSHKFGQVYPSLGWLCVRNELSLDELAHESHYLGKPIKRYPIQFSHSAAPLCAQEYYVKTWGKSGYEALIQRFFAYQQEFVEILRTFKEIKVITPGITPSLPGIIFTVNGKSEHHLAGLATYLASVGWHLPTFRLPSPHHDTLVSRIMIRNGFTQEIMQILEKELANYFTSTPE